MLPIVAAATVAVAAVIDTGQRHEADMAVLRAPAGLFASGADGTAVHVDRTAVPLATTGTIAVTLEPAGGVAAPMSQPVIAAAL